MSPEVETYYQRTPGLEIVWLAQDKVLLSCNASGLLLEGQATRLLIDRVLPLLDGHLSLRKVIDRVPELEGTDIESHLQDMAREGILLPVDGRSGSKGQSHRTHPLSSLFPLSALTPAEAQDIVGSARIAIFGLEGPGASLAVMLVQHGIDTLVLADPYPCEAGNLALMPSMSTESVGAPRQEIVRRHLLSSGGGTAIRCLGTEHLTAADIESAAEECDFLVACFDRGFGSIKHWINRASLRQNKPAIFADLDAHTATIGPLVVPGVTACYTCYRMRALACAEDLEVAQALERHFDNQELPRMHARSVLPSISHLVAATLCTETIKHFLGLSDYTLAGRIMKVSALDTHTDPHAVLAHPHCPDCKKKDSEKRVPARLSDLLEDAADRGNLVHSAKDLVGNHAGIVTVCRLLQKDQREPRIPYVSYAALSNFRLAPESQQQKLASGKGATQALAKASAIGEAIESYAAGSWDADEIVHACRSELDGPALDPRELGLYRDEQYAELPYARYSETARLGWIRARSLVSDRVIFVPAIAVLLDYAAAPGENLFPLSSTGLGAGETLPDAVLRGALEVIERDAFLIAWANHLNGVKIDPVTHPDPAVRTYCRAAYRRGLGINLICLPTDAPVHVFMAITTQSTEDGPAAAVGLGADFDPAAAARSAIWEADQVRTVLKLQLRNASARERLDHLTAHLGSVSALEDHALLYCGHGSMPAFDFLLDRPTQAFTWQAPHAMKCHERLTRLVDHFAAEHRDLLYVDLTPIDLAQINLHVARSLIPGYQPLHFGAKACRMGGTRLFDLPVRLGLRATASTPAALNPDPHPLG
jgi:bacteriocin biosynthesis cyclodehydratase domain-containing protein